MQKLWWIGVFILSGRLLPVSSGTCRSSSVPALPENPLAPSSGHDADQGIEGIVYPVSGNQMPSPDHKPGPPRGIRSTVYVFELTNNKQVTRQGNTSYYPMVNTKLIKQEDTDDSGYFRIKLPPGIYSVFTRKGDLFYASRRDEKNNIAPVEVVAGKYAKVDCKIEGDRKPVY